MSMNLQQTKEVAINCITANLVPFIQSSPGMGKSALCKEIADEFNLCLIDYRISSADPTDFNGYPEIDKATRTAQYVPFDTFPVDTTPLPSRLVDDPANPSQQISKAYDGWLLLMDELNHGSPALLRPAYKLILDKMVGQRKLHSKVRIVAAGNLSTDNAHTNKLGSALDSRVIHLFMATDYKEWLAYAGTNHFDYRITSFIGYKPDALNMFDPQKVLSGSFPCQRTWEFVHRLIKNIPVLGLEHAEMLSGAIGEGAAREFIGFTRVFQDLPTIQDIINNPHSAKVPLTADCQWAVTGLVGSNMSAATSKAIITYISRLPTEFTVLTMQDALRRNPSLINDEEVSTWIEKNMDDVV